MNDIQILRQKLPEETITFEPDTVLGTAQEPSAVASEQASAARVESPAADTRTTEETEVQVEVLADSQVTTEMHDDTTVLRDVKEQSTGLMVLDGLHFWAGGSVALDGLHTGDLLSNQSQGESNTETEFRRQEVVLRARVFDLGELKFQYDLYGNLVRDAYFRWVSDDTNQWVTVGNQKEPMAADFLEGSKFSTALERSAPSSAFASNRATGISYSRAFSLQGDDRFLNLWEGDTTYFSTSIGLFGEDVESTNSTDWAVTGRVSGGNRNASGVGKHFALSLSYREGDFDRIAPRPGIQTADRILLANPVADQQGIVATEAFYARGSLHMQGEAYFSYGVYKNQQPYQPQVELS